MAEIEASLSSLDVNKQENESPKKNWKSYLKEFFMLFLAVFCGFLAENYREIRVERQQENEFIRSYIEDLKSDTASIRQVITLTEEKQTKMDSLMLLLKNQTIEGREGDLYYFSRQLIRGFSFQSNDRTFSQLENSGGFRLIRHKHLSDSIMAYKLLVDQLNINYDDEKFERYNALDVITQMFDPFVFDQMVNEKGIRRIIGNPRLRSYDPSLQQDLAHWAHQLKGSDYLIATKLKVLNQRAIRLIDLLDKEYDLSPEEQNQ